jgi:hypothetical protein
MIGEAEGSTLGNFAVQLAARDAAGWTDGLSLSRSIRTWAARLAEKAS